MKNSFKQKQIPTLLGMFILIAALIGGIFFIGQGGGVFAPRATAETEPKKVTLTNIKDDSFTVSFFTDGSTAGFIKYGTNPTSITSQASDDRDQFSGNVGQFNTHQITLHDLQPDTTYYYTLGTAASSKYDNAGQPYSIKTTKKVGSLPIAKTIYGTVNTSSGSPASGALVYVNIDGAYQLSALTKDSGSWAIPLANARNSSTGEYRAVDATEQLSITVQGPAASSVSSVSVSVADSQPVNTITLGQDQSSQTTSTGTQSDASSITPVLDNPISDATTVNPGTDQTDSPLADASNASGTSTPVTDQVPVDTTSSLGSLTAPPDTSTIVQVNSTTSQSVATAQPMIEGIAVPNVLVNVEIHSDAQITTQVQTDAQGNYSVDLQQLEQQLEPGSHTITISYADPNNAGKTITQTKTFTVQSQGLIAAANITPTPFSTNNPFVIATPTPNLLPSPTATLSATPTATTSTVISKVGTGSALPRSGSTETTVLLIVGGIFFLMTGGFSYWATARQSEPEDLG